MFEFFKEDCLSRMLISLETRRLAASEVYEKTRTYLVERYGPPNQETTPGESSKSKRPLSFWRSCFWKTKKSLIDLTCQGKECVKGVSIRLRSREFKPKLDIKDL